MSNKDFITKVRSFFEQALYSPVSNINLLKPTGHVMHHQFNIQQLYALPNTVFMCFVFI